MFFCLVQRFLNKYHIEHRMFLQVCDFKNAGVAGYAEAFGIAQLRKQASYMWYLFRNRCTGTCEACLYQSKTVTVNFRLKISEDFFNNL